MREYLNKIKISSHKVSGSVNLIKTKTITLTQHLYATLILWDERIYSDLHRDGF